MSDIPIKLGQSHIYARQDCRWTDLYRSAHPGERRFRSGRELRQINNDIEDIRNTVQNLEDMEGKQVVVHKGRTRDDEVEESIPVLFSLCPKGADHADDHSPHFGNLHRKFPACDRCFSPRGAS